MVKKLISVAIGTGMIFATTIPAFAAIQCGNQTTGASSINICTRVANKTKTISAVNSGTVRHAITKTAVTGGNASNYNTQGGLVNAGKADVIADSFAALNTASVTANQSDTTGDETGLNDITGYNSNNQVSIQTIKTLSLGMSNDGTVNHTVTGTASTGGNSASYNTVGGSVTSGDATVNSTVTTYMNDVVIDVTQ